VIKHVAFLVEFLPAVLSPAYKHRVEALGLLLHDLSLDVGLSAVMERLDMSFVSMALSCLCLFICIEFSGNALGLI
jgi:hypothetical protein